jgi:hypothetical protein
MRSAISRKDVTIIRNLEYTQLKVSVPSQIAAAFKSSCSTSGVSMASVLSQYMAKYSAAPHKNTSTPSLATKRQRRTAIEKVITQLQYILHSEESYRDRIPENLRSSSVFDAADYWVSSLEDVIESLASLP